jgi:hypothetical protein
MASANDQHEYAFLQGHVLSSTAPRRVHKPPVRTLSGGWPGDYAGSRARPKPFLIPGGQLSIEPGHGARRIQGSLRSSVSGTTAEVCRLRTFFARTKKVPKKCAPAARTAPQSVRRAGRSPRFALRAPAAAARIPALRASLGEPRGEERQDKGRGASPRSTPHGLGHHSHECRNASGHEPIHVERPRSTRPVHGLSAMTRVWG